MAEFEHPAEATAELAEAALWAEFKRGADMRVDMLAEDEVKNLHRPIFLGNWQSYIAADGVDRSNTRFCCYLAGVLSAALAVKCLRTCILIEDITLATKIVKDRRSKLPPPGGPKTMGLVC